MLFSLEHYVSYTAKEFELHLSVINLIENQQFSSYLIFTNIVYLMN